MRPYARLHLLRISIVYLGYVYKCMYRVTVDVQSWVWLSPSPPPPPRSPGEGVTTQRGRAKPWMTARMITLL
jgi:hypothetical protein